MRNVVIMGSGPAGLTAALYAARANLSPLVISGTEAGGQLMLTTMVENYPGFPDGILGPELIELMRKQAQRFGTEFMQGDVVRAELRERPFKIYVGNDEPIETRTLIIASGASAKWLGLESEARLVGRGVSSCATCDGFFFKGKEVVVVGGGDTAMEEALFLTKFATKVTVIHRRDRLRASKIMQEKAFKNEKIDWLWDTIVIDILGDEEKGVEGVRLKNLRTGDIFEKACAGVFVAIGHQPNTALFRGQLDMDERGYIKTYGGTRTSVPGVFAAGDVQDPTYRQAITAAGSGCMAAMDAEKFLEGLDHYK